MKLRHFVTIATAFVGLEQRLLEPKLGEIAVVALVQCGFETIGSLDLHLPHLKRPKPHNGGVDRPSHVWSDHKVQSVTLDVYVRRHVLRATKKRQMVGMRKFVDKVFVLML